ncbi:MAG: signal peptide peptidase SppA [Planctomycetota bacterium]|nr:signal peptide peptidase SppA [Planctomycetota bacterium]
MQRVLRLSWLVGSFCLWLPLARAADATKPLAVVRFTLSGEYPEEADSAGLLGLLSSLKEDRATLFEMIERIDAAAKDKSVAAVWLKFDEFTPAPGSIHEFRTGIERLRKAGKPVYAELHSGAESGAYQVAVACDKIYMPEGTDLEILGPRVAIQHYKGLLDKLGLQFDVLRMGRCKGAYEPFTHENMSLEVRENYQALVDDRYDALVETIAAGRHLEAPQVKQLIDHGVFTAPAAQQAGLVDMVVQAAHLEDELQKTLQAPAGLKVVTNYKQKQQEEITGIMDLMKLFAGGGKTKKSAGKKKIAVVYETGEITTGKSGNSLTGGKTQGSTTISKLLRKLADDPSVKAVVVRIDGPGGSATASNLIWQETMRTRQKKPVISSLSSVAASGTYFTAVAGHRIYAEPDTLTGSIGVIGGKLVTQALFQKLGVHEEFIGRGALSGVELDRPYTPAERKVLTEMVEECYRDFVGKVAQCRNLPPEQVASLAEGRVYTARQAKKLGLVDELGTLNDALAAAKQAAGLKPDEEVDIVRYPEERSIFELLGGDRDDQATLRLAAQAVGIPASLLRRLPIPSFLLCPERSGRPHLYYWASIPQMK